MITLTLNKRSVSVQPGKTILDAANQIGIEIPTLCHLERFEPYTSCMVCVVYDEKLEKLVPACSAPATEGMRIETDNELVHTFRKDTLDLLLSEHVGNCEAPCTRSCPAYMNIPLMIKQIREKDFASSLRTVKKNIALPAVLGRICPAPCERGCNRKYHDDSLSICLLKRFVADTDLETAEPFIPDILPLSGKKIAVIGAGPAGLAAAYYLAQSGHSCHIFDQNELPGGLLRYGIPDDKLDKKVLDREIGVIAATGDISWHMESTFGRDFSMAELRKDYQAIILTIGAVTEEAPGLHDLETTKRGITVDRKTFESSIPGVFAGGNAISEGRMAIRSLGHGRFIADSVDQYLNGQPVAGYRRRFNSVIGRLNPDEAGQLMQLAEAISRVEMPGETTTGFADQQAVNESTRCFRCDCRKPDSCKLRVYSDQYNVEQQRFRTGDRGPVKLITDHPEIIFETGKCIKCGLCVRVCEAHEEIPGLAFARRGYRAGVEVPFSDSLDIGLGSVAAECVQVCPTGALAFRLHTEDEKND